MTVNSLSTGYPEKWKFMTLNYLNKRHSMSINPRSFPNEKFEYYSIPAYQDGETPTLTFGREIESLKLLLEEGTILFGKLNPRVEKVWKVGDYFDCRKIGSTEWIPVLPVDEIENDFLYYLFWSEHVMSKAKTLVSGSTPSRQRVDPKAFYQLQVPVPPRTEQQNISYVLHTIQNAIKQQEQLIDLTRELKSALMKKLFTEGLCGEKQKTTTIGLVPESWNILPLDDLLTKTQYGLSVKGQTQGKYGILRMTNQVEGKISNNDVQFVNISDKEFTTYQLKRGDILFNRTNSHELVGRTAIFDIPGDYVFASYLIRLNTNPSRYSPFFLNQYLNWDETQERLKTIALRAISQSNISATRLRTFLVPVPSLEEQDKIVSNIDVVTKKIELHTKKKLFLEELFRSLLHKLMTGQIRVDGIELKNIS